MKVLVGYTGLIGKTLLDKAEFDFQFNSSNIKDFNNLVENGADLYLACLPATMWMVNKDTVKDLQNIIDIVELIKEKKYNNVYLFSTIEIYCNSEKEVDEDYIPKFDKTIYGSNRYLFELLIKENLNYKNLKIFRLPALFGKHLKKNIFFDLMNDNQVDIINTSAIFQWYNLENLWSDLVDSDKIDSNIINLFSEPISVKEIVEKVFEMTLENPLSNTMQNFKTKNKKTGYWETKENIIFQMKEFLNENWR